VFFVRIVTFGVSMGAAALLIVQLLVMHCRSRKAHAHKASALHRD